MLSSWLAGPQSAGLVTLHLNPPCPKPVQVWLLDFSPCEKYLVTYSSQEPSNPREKASVLFNVFETRTGASLQSSRRERVHLCFHRRRAARCRACGAHNAWCSTM